MFVKLGYVKLSLINTYFKVLKNIFFLLNLNIDNVIIKKIKIITFELDVFIYLFIIF